MLVEGSWGGSVSEEVVDQDFHVFGDVAEYHGEEAAYHRLFFAEVDQVGFVSGSDGGRDGWDERYQGDESEKTGQDDISD